MSHLRTFGTLTVAAITCPCHLPLVLGLLGGTSVGALLAANILPAFVVLSAVFVAALVVFLRAFATGSGALCPGDDVRRPR